MGGWRHPSEKAALVRRGTGNGELQSPNSLEVVTVTTVTSEPESNLDDKQLADLHLDYQQTTVHTNAGQR